MVRSSGSHHRKRSRSRSVTPDHKRSKSSRDYDKERTRRRSRSRDRIRRSRSRDRKKDKKISESRVRSKPLKLKRRTRSRSRSRSKSKDKNLKKEEKKDAKVEDEPFDPTNLDKVSGEEEEWVVTDVIEEPVAEDNGNLEEEMDYEADEDDQYSHTSSFSHPNSPSRSNVQSEEVSITTENDKEVDNSPSKQGNDKETVSEKQDNEKSTDENSPDKNEKEKNEVNETVKDTVSKLKEISSLHKEKIKMISTKREMERLNSKNHSYRRSHNNYQRSEDLAKEQIRQSIKLDKELHELRMKHEIARHRAELEVIRAQLHYWKNKH